MSARTDQIDVDVARRGIVVIRLNRPEKLNAMTSPMFEELSKVCDSIHEDVSVRGVVLVGAGRAFCSGLDLDEVQGLRDLDPADFMRRQRVWSRVVADIRGLPVPVVAAVNGPAAGAGMSLALACDVRIGTPSTSFSAAFIRVGLTGGDLGSSWFLPRIVGLGLASELLLSGRRVDASEAEAIGLLNASAADSDSLLPHALDVAESFAANTAFGLDLTRQVIDANASQSLTEALALENRNQALSAVQQRSTPLER